MTKPSPDHVLWLDLETTDTDPFVEHAAILEIGAVITTHTPSLDVLAEASLLVRPPGTQHDHDQLWARMLPVVREMHTSNGLWQDATTDTDAWSITEADDALARWVTEETGSTRSVPLAGSGTGHMDLPWVKRFMPRLTTRLTYWPLDIGVQRRMLELAGRPDHVDLATDVDAKPHRGLGDVRLHVA
jgi:oligoribonuclease